MKFLSLIIVAMGLSTAAFAKPVQNPYFEIKSMKVEEVQDRGLGLMGNLDQSISFIQIQDAAGEIGAIGAVFDEAVVLGKKIWKLIADNRPVYKVNVDVASIVPKTVTDWQQLEGWQAPQSRVYRVTYQNGFGSDVIDFSYRVLFTSGGSLNGKGKYLSYVTIMPANLEVSWGYTFNATSKIANITNAGTKESPVAASQVNMEWSVDTILKHAEATSIYYMNGNGEFKNLTQTNPNL